MNDEDDATFGFTDEFRYSDEQSNLSCNSADADRDQTGYQLSLDTYPETYQKEVLRRLEVIKFVEKRLRGGWSEKNLTPLLLEAKDVLQVKTPSWRVLVSWKDAYFNSGRSIHSLVPKHHLKGNRKQHTDSDIYIDLAINQKYMTMERLSVADTYKHYKSLVLRANRDIVDGKIKLLSQRAFYDRVNALPAYDVMLARYGKRYADRHFRPIGQLIPATYPLEYVDIDHTPAPVILVDDELDIAIGRPYLTILYDRFSKCIIGLSVSYREPSYDSVRKAFLEAVLKKGWIKEKYPMIEHDWPCFGKIENLVVDNGAEFWSESLDDALKPLVTDIRYCKSAKPWEKTGIEKFFDQLNKGLINSFPGKTFVNITQLKDYDPKKNALVRVSTFLELLYKWVIDDYHIDSDSRDRAIPYHKWNSSKWTPNFYQGKEEVELRIELGLLRHRTIRSGGINLHSLRYQSDELIEYRKYNSESKDNLYVKTKTDPSNIDHIFVFLKNEHRYIKVPVVDNVGYASGLSLFEHRIIQRVNRLNTRALVDEESLADTRLYIDERINQDVDRLSKRHKNTGALPKTSNISKLAKFKDVGSNGPKSITHQRNNIIVEADCNEDAVSNDDIEDFDDIEGY